MSRRAQQNNSANGKACSEHYESALTLKNTWGESLIGYAGVSFGSAIIVLLSLAWLAGGIFIFHTTNRKFYQIAIASLLPQWLKNAIIYALTRRKGEDVYSTAYKINTPAAVRRMVEESGMKLLDLRMISSAGETALLGPVVLIELAITRLLETRRLRDFRSNMIVILQNGDAVAGKPERAIQSVGVV